MITKELIDYINTARAAGMTPIDMKATLQANGWIDTDIDEGLAAAGLNDLTATQPNSNSANMTPARDAQVKRNSNPHSHKILIIGVSIALLIAISAIAGGLIVAFPFFSAHTATSSGVLATSTPATATSTTTFSTPVTSTSSNPVSNNTKFSSSAPITSPKEAYLVIKAAEEQVKTYSDAQAFILKYDVNGTTTLAEMQQKISAAPASQQAGIKSLVAEMFSFTPVISDFASITESVRGNTATLTITTTKTIGKTGIIAMVLEGNQWKLGNESWYNGPPPGPEMNFSVGFHENVSNISSLILTDPLGRKAVFDINNPNGLQNQYYGGACSDILGDKGCYIAFSPTYSGTFTSKGVAVITTTQPVGTYTLTVNGNGNYTLEISAYAKDGSQEPTFTQNETATSGVSSTFRITFSESPGSAPIVVKL